MARAVCGICGKERQQDSLVCPRCFTEYRQQAFKKEGASNLLDWVQGKAETRISDLQTKREDLATLKERLNALSKEVGDETMARLQNMLGGERISQGEWQGMFDELRKRVWQEKRGNALYAQFKQLEAEIVFLDDVNALLADIAHRREMQKEEKSVNDLLASVFAPGTTEKK